MRRPMRNSSESSLTSLERGSKRTEKLDTPANMPVDSPGDLSEDPTPTFTPSALEENNYMNATPENLAPTHSTLFLRNPNKHHPFFVYFAPLDSEMTLVVVNKSTVIYPLEPLYEFDFPIR
jgi:hypothetical protein